MSPLTKLFVVLHVVLSLLVTAGLIVFVNKTENFRLAQVNLQNAKAAAENRANAATEDAQNARESADKLVSQANAQVSDITKQLAAAQTQVASKDAELAKAASASAMAAADSARLTDALKASEDQKAKQSEALATGRTDADSLVKKNADLNLAVSDLTNRLDVATRERTNFSEQLAQSQGQVEKDAKLFHDFHIDPNQQGGLQPNLGAVAINGVVREKALVNNIPYATISVGAADDVQKGMKFNVIDRQGGKFLGYLTIDTVEPHSATGRLEGPSIDQVTTNTEVRTQL